MHFRYDRLILFIVGTLPNVVLANGSHKTSEFFTLHLKSRHCFWSLYNINYSV